MIYIQNIVDHRHADCSNDHHPSLLSCKSWQMDFMRLCSYRFMIGCLLVGSMRYYKHGELEECDTNSCFIVFYAT